MIVATLENEGCTCYVDDSGYVDKTPEEVERIVQQFSNFIAECMRKKKTA